MDARARRRLDGHGRGVHRHATSSAGPTTGRSTWSTIPDAHYVVLADYVTTEDGSGLVHQAPAFGADDLAVCRAYGLPVVNPVRPDGTFDADVPLVGGQLLQGRRRRRWSPTSRRAACCSAHVSPTSTPTRTAGAATPPLIYYAQPSWYIRTTAVKDALLRENERTNWYPEHDQVGPLRRLAEQQRRLGAVAQPLLGHAAADLALRATATSPASGRSPSLASWPGTDLSGLDPHRPFVDDVTFACPSAAQTAVRVPEVIDALVRLRLDAVRAVGLPAPRTRSSSSGATPRSSSARRSTRPAAGSTR